MSKGLSWTFSRGTVFDKNRVYVLMYSNREKGTRVFRWTRKWDNYYVPGVSNGICSVFKPQPEILTMCVDGMIHSAGPEGQSRVFVDESSESPFHRGILTDIRVIDDHVYVTGLGRQVYRREASGTWVRWDAGVVDPLTSDEVNGFESIDGFAEKEIYAVGKGGDMWLCNENHWEQLDSPTNLILKNVLCAPDGTVYICGQIGTVIRGRCRTWEIVDHDATEETIWDMVWFKQRLWLATINSLFVLEGNKIEEVDTGFSNKPSYQYLDANDGVMWSFGSSNLIYYDGQSWSEVSGP